MTGKFDSQRDEVLYALGLGGWANKSTGSDDFGATLDLITNDAQDVALDNGEFVSLFESMGFEFELDSSLSADLVGTFIVMTAESGAVTVVAGDAPDVVAAFEHVEVTFDRWAMMKLHGE